MTKDYYRLEESAAGPKGAAGRRHAGTPVRLGADQHSPSLPAGSRLRIAANDAVQSIPDYRDRAGAMLLLAGAATGLGVLLLIHLLRR